jgi:hypothetical protein
MAAQQDNPYFTITLTGRPPVKIKKDDWPLYAEGNAYIHDGQVECQANEKTKWRIAVLRHADGRAIIFAVYSHDTNWQNRSCYGLRGGELLPAASEIGEIISAIQRVGQWMIDNMPSEKSDDSEIFSRLINECIADLPAEEL